MKKLSYIFIFLFFSTAVHAQEAKMRLYEFQGFLYFHKTKNEKSMKDGREMVQVVHRRCFPSVNDLENVAGSFEYMANDVIADTCYQYLIQTENGRDPCLNRVYAAIMYDQVFRNMKPYEDADGIRQEIIDNLEKTIELIQSAKSINRDFFKTLPLADENKNKLLETFSGNFDQVDSGKGNSDDLKRKLVFVFEYTLKQAIENRVEMKKKISELLTALDYNQKEITVQCGERSIDDVLKGFQENRNMGESLNGMKIREVLQAGITEIDGFENLNMAFSDAYEAYVKATY